jgi:tetratricopeptide (TPR) repeat protein
MADDTETATLQPVASPITDLRETERRVLSYAASMGMEFDISVLAIATEMEEEPLAESLEQLVHRGILKELNWGDSYAFVQVVTLAQAYRDISSSRLRVIHKKIAEAYEKLHPDPTPDVIPEMGRHFHLAQVHDKSLLYNRYAAALSMNAFSPDVAIRYLERAREDLAVLPGDHRVEEAEVLKEIGEQYSAMGDETRADSFYGESLSKLPEEETIMRALLLLSRSDALRVLDRLDLARQYCEEAIQLLEKVGHKKGLALAHRSLARTAFKEDLFEVGKREIEATIALLDPEKDVKDVAHCYIEFGNVLSAMPISENHDRALEYFHRAIQILEPLRDYHEIARAHNCIAVTILQAQPREGLIELKEAKIYAEKCKDRRLIGWALFNCVEPLLALGEEAEATRDNAEARQILSKINDQMGVQQVTLNEGLLAQYRKAYAESERSFLDALRQAEHLGYQASVAEVIVHMANMYMDWGKNEEASKAIARMKVIGEDILDPSLRPLLEKLKQRLGK